MNGIDSPSESSDDQDQDVEQDHKPKIKKRRNIGTSQNSFQKMIDHSKIAMKKTVSAYSFSFLIIVDLICGFGNFDDCVIC